MNNNKLIVIYKEVGKIPKLVEIENSIGCFEKLVGGQIDIIPYEDILVICRKNRNSLQPNIFLNTITLNLNYSIRGNIIIISKLDNQYISLTKGQTVKYIELLKKESFNYKQLENIEKLKTKNIKDKFEIDNINEFNSEEVLKMILGIQSIILQFIKNNSDID